jgi:hypothetical protein
MAELPRYQPTGYLPADVPRLDFANLKESVAMTQGISAALDRLSNFAFKEAEEKARREGMQWAPENAPTPEQVLAAKDDPNALQKLFAKPGTAFGDAARKIQAIQLRTELESIGRQKLAELSIKSEKEGYTLDQIQQETKSLTNGYARAISAVDAEEGSRFRASISMVGSSLIATAAKKFENTLIEQRAALVTEHLASTPVTLANHIKTVSDPVELQALINAEFEKILSAAGSVNIPGFVKEKAQDFEKFKLNAIIEYAISKDFAPTEIDGYRRLITGDYGKLSEVMKKVNLDKLKTQWLEKTGNIIESNNKANALSLSINQDKVNQILENHAAGKIGGQDAYRQIKALNVTLPDGQMRALLSGEGAGATPKEFGNYESMTQRGLLGENEINNLAEKGKMSWTQANKLKQQARNPDTQMRDALSYGRAAVGAPGEMTFGFGYEKGRYERLQGQLRVQKYEALQAGKPFDPMQVMIELVKKDNATAEHQQYENDLNDFKTRLIRNGIKFDNNRIYTEKDLKDVGKRERDILLDMQSKLKRDKDQ